MTGRAGSALVVVGTPIGNLGDLAPRAVEELRRADLVACEDTRRTGRLLELAGVGHRPMVVLNEHTERERTAQVLARIAAGERVVLVTDAGMPAISDPGQHLVAEAVAAGHAVEVVPGPSAVVAALAVSGLPARRFAFEGFLPRKGRERSEALDVVAREPRTVVLYEAPHRLARTLADLRDRCGAQRQVAIARELTKLHEEVWRGTLGDAAAWAGDREPPGEHVVVVEGAPAAAPVSDDAVRAAVDAELAAGATPRDAAAAVAAELGVPKRRAYEEATTTPRRPGGTRRR